MRAKGLTFILSLCLCIHGLAHPGTGATHIWTFDEDGESRALDMAGDRSGTVYGAKWVPGRVGAALQFDGWDDYVALPNNEPVWLPVNDFSVCFWVYFERDKGSSYYDNEVLVDLNHGSSGDSFNELGYLVLRRGDTAELGFQMTTMTNSDDDLYARTIPVKGRWYHVAAVRRGTLQEIYIDGELDAWRACSSTPIDFVGGYDDDRVNVGRYTNTAGPPRYHFEGMMDELMIFDRALSSTAVQQLYRDVTTPGDLYVDGTHGSDTNTGLSPRSSLATIQKAIDLAKNGDVINVYPGVYREEVRFLGKAITLQSIGDAAVIEAPDGFGVSFYMGEGPDTVLRNFVIANSYIGIFCAHSTPTIANVTITNNVYGVDAYGRSDTWRALRPSIGNSIIWDNTENDVSSCEVKYSCVQLTTPLNPMDHAFLLDGDNFNSDPLFVDPEGGDYHVRSARGRYWPERDVWVLDDVTSPCVDTGDPGADFSSEPLPNGGRLNVGAHGGTIYAERNEVPFSGDINADGVFDATDYDMFMTLWRQHTQPPEPPTTTPRRR
ncbi:MAG: hypothetical protein EHM35_02440 [Planctomycetaceae bacterium]|nr:MAG: hypothetical protein EHM35_02440 [Planctomycetaceae bacterium]